MTFLNQALAFGAAAFVIPLVIHILNRSRFRTVEWGAMHLLESVIRVNHKRFHLEQLILLLVRCAIPVLLALCLARPVLTGSRMLEGNSPVSLVILLDTSYSMDTVSQAGSRFDDAVSAASTIVAAVQRGSEISVIQTGGRPTPMFDQPVFDPHVVVRQLERIRAGYGASDMQAALEEALATLSAMSHARRELVVISDFQPADWGDTPGGIAETFRQQVDALDIKPALTLLPVGKTASGNLSVESVEFPRHALGVGQQVTVRANIRNHGATSYDRARAILRLDGAEQSVSEISLAASGSTQTLFACVLEKPGSHVLEVEVVANDSLQADNRFAVALTTWDSVKVLLVDGDPSSQPLQSETDYLSVALTPFTFGRVQLTDLVETQTIAAQAIGNELLSESRVVVLANVSKLATAQLEALKSYVKGGGALLVCAGNRIDLNWYRERMFAGGAGLLPVPFGDPRGEMDDQGQSARIVAQRFDHPALEFFNDPSNGDLSTAEIRQWYELPLAETSSPAPIVMVRMDNGDPLLVERSFGEGVVVQMATAGDADWSDLPLRPFFVPLMQQLVTTMASRIAPPRNIVAGEPAAALFEADDGASSVAVVTPDGSRRTLQLVPREKMQLARWEDTQRPGVYVMTGPSGETLHFAAETSRSESDLTVLDEPGVAAVAEAMGASVVHSSDEYLKLDGLRRHGREIWKYVLGGLLAFMALELVLQQRFARVRT